MTQNASMIIAENPTVILSSGTVIQIDEEFGLIWFHPKGYRCEGSYRLNLKLKMVDVQVGAQK